MSDLKKWTYWILSDLAIVGNKAEPRSDPLRTSLGRKFVTYHPQGQYDLSYAMFVNQNWTGL